MTRGRFGTAINCMDGRVHLPTIDWMTKELGVDYVDIITEPGPDKLLAEGSAEQVASIRTRLELSVEKHGSKHVVIMGHHDCAGNPVPRDTHIVQINEAMRVIESWNLPVTIYGAWINRGWQVEVVGVIERP